MKSSRRWWSTAAGAWTPSREGDLARQQLREPGVALRQEGDARHDHHDPRVDREEGLVERPRRRAARRRALEQAPHLQVPLAQQHEMGLRRGVASSSNNTSAAVTSKSEHRLNTPPATRPEPSKNEPSHFAMSFRERGRPHVAPQPQ